MTALEEKKKTIAKWMGWRVDWSPNKEDGYPQYFKKESSRDWVLFDEWNPEKGGKDLTEVLAKLDGVESVLLFHKIEKRRKSIVSNFSSNVIRFAIWFRNPDNAETILNAVYEVIENES